MNVLLTGANGFVGRAMRQWLLSMGHSCVAATRSVSVLPDGNMTQAVGDISSLTDWQQPLKGVDVVIHLAGRAHVRSEQPSNVEHLFNAVNVDATANLVRQAIACGVKRFIYVSSIGVHGASTQHVPISETSPLTPYSAYTKSKCRAELELQALAEASYIEWVIVRPPLIYAADAPGNFQQLLKVVANGLPLPFAGVSNSRSMIALENLVDFLGICCVHTNAANQSFVICDSHDLSTPAIATRLALGMGKKAKIFWLPDRLIKTAARLVGRQHTYTQLFGSLQVDARKATDRLGWEPVIAAPDALIKAGQEFLANTV